MVNVRWRIFQTEDPAHALAAGIFQLISRSG
jgi:hypothetical protein